MAKKPKQRAKDFRNAEAQWRKDQVKVARMARAADRSEFQHDRFAGAGLLGRALDTMYNVYNPGQKIGWQPPKPRDGAGKPLFGRYRGSK